MANVQFVKAARKDYPEQGIKKGEPYYWWKFAYGPKCYSKTPPRGSQLTQSEFMQTMLGHEETVSDLLDAFDADTLADDIRAIADEIESFGDEQTDKFDNMPESLQSGSTGELLTERADACSTIADELRTFADEIETAINDRVVCEETDEEFKSGVRDSYSVGWDLP